MICAVLLPSCAIAISFFVHYVFKLKYNKEKLLNIIKFGIYFITLILCFGAIYQWSFIKELSIGNNLNFLTIVILTTECISCFVSVTFIDK